MRKSEVMNPGILGLVRKVFAFMFLALAVVSCGGDDEPDGGDKDQDTPVDYAEAISGKWICIKADLLDAAGGIQETISFNGYTYKACRFTVSDKNNLKAEWMSYPSFSVVETLNLKLDGERITKDGVLYGTITNYLENGKYGTLPEIEIKWEPVAVPFNLGYTDHPTSCYYMDASWAI